MSKRWRRAIYDPGIDPGEGVFPGHFGYRNRRGRSGVDYIDTQMEFAYAQGIFLKTLVTLKLRTRNPLILGSMMIAVIVAWLPFEFLVGEAISGLPQNQQIIHYFTEPPYPIFGYLIFGGELLFLAIFGALLLINFALSLREIFKPRLK